jgi:hypothetical protein
MKNPIILIVSNITSSLYITYVDIILLEWENLSVVSRLEAPLDIIYKKIITFSSIYILACVLELFSFVYRPNQLTKARKVDKDIYKTSKQRL